MNLGVLVLLDENIEQKFEELKSMGFSNCQLCSWNLHLHTDEYAKIIKEACEKYGVRISAFWCGWSGPAVWDFYDGPETLGLIPEKYREKRIQDLKQGSDFAKKMGVDTIATHVGFLPEIPTSKEYVEIIPRLRELCEYVKANGQYFLFETGQETPVTLRRTIEDIGTDNLGINLDAANLILYGKANPIDALSVFGEYVRNIHAKDGKYPTSGKALGEETPLGKGDVNFPVFIEKLKSIGYDMDITIEREISGEEQKRDIMNAKIFLESLWRGDSK